MFKLSELSVKEGSVHKHFRRGQGIGTGNGKQAGRGRKGQRARSGSGKRPGFTGGNFPLFRRFPKVGFHSLNRTEIGIVNLDKINRFGDGANIKLADWFDYGIAKQVDGVKVLAKGKLTVKNVTVEANFFSQGAKKAIEENGGKAVVIPLKGVKETNEKEAKSKAE